jgi:hypothetical protein
VAIGPATVSTAGANASGMLEIWRVEVRIVAARHGTVLVGANHTTAESHRTCQERRSARLFFSAASPRLMCGAFGSAQKLASAVAEARTKSGACVRALSAFARVRFAKIR